jgi:hypothetical protein
MKIKSDNSTNMWRKKKVNMILTIEEINGWVFKGFGIMMEFITGVALVICAVASMVGCSRGSVQWSS